MSIPPDDYDLALADDTDDIYRRAYCLAGWGLRTGACSEYDAVDWVFSHAHEERLPRGSSGRLNPTAHHIRKGAEAAVDNYVPGAGKHFDPEPLQDLAARISGSGVTHEKYLLGVIALCFKYETLTPVVTGPLLAQVVGVSRASAGEVLRKWSNTLAYGFFADRPSYDGERGHGRIWPVNVDWTPTSKPKHEPGCNRARGRCNCLELSQSAISIFTAAVKDRSGIVRQWLDSLTWKQQVTVSDVCKALGLTRAEATKLLRSEQGLTFEDQPTEASTRRVRGGVVRTPTTWHVADRWQRWPDGERPNHSSVQ